MSNIKPRRPLNDYVAAFCTAAVTGLALLGMLPQKANSQPVSLDRERAQFTACLFDAKCKLSEFKVKPIDFLRHSAKDKF